MLRTMVCVLAPIGAALAAPQSGSSIAEPVVPKEFTISKLDLIGDACLPGTVHHLLNDEKTTSSLALMNLVVQADPSTPTFSSSKACNMTFGVDIPPGFRFGVHEVVYRGYYELDGGVTALHKSTYFFQGSPDQARTEGALRGPLEMKERSLSTPFHFGVNELSPCGGKSALFFNSEFHVTNLENKLGSGLMTSSMVVNLNFKWETC